ncbi:MAG: hypothetical protein M1168_00405 [Candidatus Marsarchaeota archaeon]|nr:hypothetical protein [Candidatus Marsarchaeota archaeon]MCL5094432.1 hypothetical protein [Candidatus Marsarchaeota archaeon]
MKSHILIDNIGVFSASLKTDMRYIKSHLKEVRESLLKRRSKCRQGLQFKR